MRKKVKKSNKAKRQTYTMELTNASDMTLMLLRIAAKVRKARLKITKTKQPRKQNFYFFMLQQKRKILAFFVVVKKNKYFQPPFFRKIFKKYYIFFKNIQKSNSKLKLVIIIPKKAFIL